MISSLCHMMTHHLTRDKYANQEKITAFKKKQQSLQHQLTEEQCKKQKQISQQTRVNQERLKKQYCLK